ncbi:hypothetical protein F5Y15DRAFT_421722 [Xylariaceae sp. FL0016]|nr:hypothetical protein F5Y15DRAFT_421722 [Xylariaceae sp. FL0016]
MSDSLEALDNPQTSGAGTQRGLVALPTPPSHLHDGSVAEEPPFVLPVDHPNRLRWIAEKEWESSKPYYDKPLLYLLIEHLDPENTSALDADTALRDVVEVYSRRNGGNSTDGFYPTQNLRWPHIEPPLIRAAGRGRLPWVRIIMESIVENEKHPRQESEARKSSSMSRKNLRRNPRDAGVPRHMMGSHQTCKDERNVPYYHERCENALDAAICSGHTDIAEYLVTEGVEDWPRDSTHPLALYAACRSGNVKAFKYLCTRYLDHKRDLTLEIRESCLMHSCKSPEHNEYIFKELLKKDGTLVPELDYDTKNYRHLLKTIAAGCSQNVAYSFCRISIYSQAWNSDAEGGETKDPDKTGWRMVLEEAGQKDSMLRIVKKIYNEVLDDPTREETECFKNTLVGAA